MLSLDEHPRHSFRLLDPEFFEPLQRYRPSDEFQQLVRQHLPDDWAMRPTGYWTTCAPANWEFVPQGWKIHIAGFTSTAIELLNRLLPFFVKERVAFKFVSDSKMLKLSTGKNWERTNSGKFITIYPPDDASFQRQIDDCHQLTRGLIGPYILTDRPYKDSRVVFYRYGGLSKLSRINAHGKQVSCIYDQDGHLVQDRRLPHFFLPPWVTDPFVPDDPPEHTSNEVALHNGRYQVTGAIKYAPTGGIYRAHDRQTGQDVIIREARAFGTGSASPFGLLQKEARILQRLEPAGVAARFVDLFQEWEHWFLVEERLEADTLWGHAIQLLFGPSRDDPSQTYLLYRSTISKLAEALDAVHERGVILRDLTKVNVMITPDGKIKFIDFELSYECDRNERPLPGFTSGYASLEQLRNLPPTPQEDYYALGALILDIISVTAAGLNLNRSGILSAFDLTVRDLGLPDEVGQIVRGLLHPEPERRLTPSQAVATLPESAVPRQQVLRSVTGLPLHGISRERLRETIEPVIKGITQYIVSMTDLSRDDRLWPASSDVFLTNPVSLQFGAAGIAWYLHRVGQHIDSALLEWILARATPQRCPPGLYIGLGGVAVFMLDLGFDGEARRILEASSDRARVTEVPGLYDGAAGWGLANLHLWLRTQEARYLDAASEIAEHLIGCAHHDELGAYWLSEDRIPFGLGQGASGVALFLTYLHAVCPQPSYLDYAIRAVDYDIANVSWTHGLALAFPYKNDEISRSPHMSFGSIGIASAALRLFAITNEVRYRRFADSCAVTISGRINNKLWQDYGIAGHGEFLIDMYRVTGDEAYLDLAYYLAEALLPHQIIRDYGITFAGYDLQRVSCDVGTGSAGIGLFLDRLLEPRARLLFPDHILGIERELTSHSVPLTATVLTS